MRKTATPSKVTQAHRWKQHLRRKPYNSSFYGHQNNDRQLSRANKNQVITPKMTKMGRFYKKMSLSEKRVNKTKIKLPMPPDFCIFSNPESVIKLCGNVFSLFKKNRVTSIEINHNSTKKYSLGSEVLFGLSCAEGERYRAINNLKQIRLLGNLPVNKDHEYIIRDLGILSELDSLTISKGVERDPFLVHVFKSECLTHDTPSALALDAKNKTTIDVILHLNRCLQDYQLELKEDAAQRFKNCISEMLDNAIEHCNLTHPAWYVRSYLNSNGVDKFFELTILNFGCSYAESFTRLGKDHFAREFVDKYIRQHKNSVDEAALYTVVALQGRVSSKNTNDMDTRGQGTIVLIESFEQMYQEIKKLRPMLRSGCESVMNLISGNTIIHFDGMYHSRSIPLDDGAERVIYAINQEQDLKIPPSKIHVRTMKNAFFPGAMINIRLPLSELLVSKTL